MAKKEGQVIYKKDKYDSYKCKVSRKHAEMEDSSRFAMISLWTFTVGVVLFLFMLLLGG